MRAGKRLRQIQIERGITQTALSDAVGMKQGDLSRLEKQSQNRVVENWIRMAKYLGVTVEELYYGKDA